MKHSLIIPFGIATAGLLLLVQSASPSLAQITPPTFAVPLAYIGGDGNVYVQSAGSSTQTPITQDASFSLTSIATSQPTHNYSHPRWSPDGKTVAFVDSVTRNLFVSPAGGPPKQIATNLAADYPVAWLPDSSAIVYAVDSQSYNASLQSTFNLEQIAPDGSNLSNIATFQVQGGCGGGGLDQGGVLTGMETGFANNPKALAWTKYGWLVSNTCRGDGLALINSSNQIAWKDDALARASVSPDGSHAVAVIYNTSQGSGGALVSLDLSSGRYIAYNAVPAAEQVGWSADGQNLYYSTVSGTQVTLWKIPSQGAQPTQLFADHGHALGAIASSPDSQMVVFSYIPDGASPQTALLAVPANTSTSATLASAATIAQGGRPAFAIPASTSVSPTLSPATPVNCTVRTDWQYTYVVSPGDTLSQIAQRDATTAAILAQGNCLADINTIFAGQTLRVPNPIQALPTLKRITFLPGEISGAVTGQVGAYPAIDQWVIRVLGGQTLQVRLLFSTGQARLTVYGADGTVLLGNQANASSFSGVVPNTQDYYLAVQDVSGAGTSYSLSVTASPGQSATNPAPGGVKRISFAAGATSGSVSGALVGNGIDHWVINVQGGQTLTAQLSTTAAQAILIIYGANGTVLQTDHAGSPGFSGVVPSTQDYFIDVRDVSGAGENYVLTVTIPALPPSQPTAKRISFAAGAISASVKGKAPPNAVDRWVINVSAGQTLSANLPDAAGRAIIVVFGADGNVLQSDHVGSPSFSGVVPTTQDYFIDVRDITGGGTAYTLAVTVPPLGGGMSPSGTKTQ